MTLSSFLAVLLASLSYKVIAFLMALESSVFPVPSEIVIIPAGLRVASGALTWYGVLLASLVGTIAGSLLSYAVARHFGRRAVSHFISRYGSFLLLRKEHLERTDLFFRDNGRITIFIGRFIPVIRHLISLPAGFARMPVGTFTLYTALGAGIWSVVLLVIGYTVGANQALIQHYLNFTTVIILAVCVIVVAAYVYLKKK